MNPLSLDGVEVVSRSDFSLSTWGVAGGGFSETGVDASMLSISGLTSPLLVGVTGRTLSDFGLGGCSLLTSPLPPSPYPGFFSSKEDAGI